MSDFVLWFILFQLVFLIPSYYLYRWMWKKTGLALVDIYAKICTVLCPLLFTWLFIIVNERYIYPWIRSESFNSSKWRTNEEYRYRMVNDVINRGILIGKTKHEVLELMGKDTEEGPCNDCIGYSTNEPDQGFSLDHEVLEINFEQDRVISASINHW